MMTDRDKLLEIAEILEVSQYLNKSGSSEKKIIEVLKDNYRDDIPGMLRRIKSDREFNSRNALNPEVINKSNDFDDVIQQILDAMNTDGDTHGSNISDEYRQSRLEKFQDQAGKKPTKENKVERVRLVGGIAGMIGTSPRRALASKIEEVNQQGWYVRQVIPDDTGNLLIAILRTLILCLTLFIYTPANGYLLILERDQS